MYARGWVFECNVTGEHPLLLRFVNGLTVRNNRLDGNDMEARGFTLYDCDEVLFENNVVLNSKTTTLHVCLFALSNSLSLSPSPPCRWLSCGALSLLTAGCT